MKDNTYRAGIWAEYVAAAFLTVKGYRILKLRYKTKVGEIDLIAKRGGVICFVEVKYRSSLDDACAAVSPQSMSRIRRAAEHYLLGNGAESSIVRFDVIGLSPQLRIRHIKNAF
jgi:putative endonuclease